MFLRLTLCAVILLTVSCSKPESKVSGQKEYAHEAVPKIGSDLKAQPYSIVLADHITQPQLPVTSNMKLAGFDIGAYVDQACKDTWQAMRCDVFAQIDPNGALSGYLVLSQYKDGLSFTTDTMTTPRTAESRSCELSGKLDGESLDPTKNFESRSEFHTTDGAIGMIYLNKVGQNLRVQDERWNYCYPDRHIDDVYVLMGSLVRQIDPSHW